MHVEKISIGRGKKLSVNYNSYDYHVSVSVELEDGDTTDKAYNLALSTLKILETKEANKIKEELE